MKKYRVYDIQWDVDGDMETLASLPKEMIVALDSNLDGEDVYNELSEKLSDETGFCHKSFEVEEMRYMYVALPLYGQYDDGDFAFGAPVKASDSYDDIRRYIETEITENGKYDGIVDFSTNTVEAFDPDSYDPENDMDGWLPGDFNQEDFDAGEYSGFIAIHELSI